MSNKVSNVRTTLRVPPSNTGNFAVTTDESQYCQLEITSAKAGANAANHPVLAGLSRVHPELGDDMVSLYQELFPYQSQVMDWLQADPANAAVFAENPLQTFQRITNAPESLLNKITAMQKKWPECPGTGPDQHVNTHLFGATPANAVTQDFAQGWDVVSAVRQKELNNGLLLAYNAGLTPKDIEAKFEIKFGPIKIPVSVKVTFGPMQIKSGTGTNIDLTIPITGGSIKFGDNDPGSDLSGINIIMTVNLIYVKSPVQPETGHKYEFQIDISNTGAFVGIDLENLPSFLKDQKAALEAAFLELLRNQIPGHPYKVFEITLAGIDADYPYLIPNLVQYAFINDAKNPDDNVLGALLLTTGKTPGTDQLLAGTVPDDCRAALIISNQLFMEKVILSQVLKGLNVDASYFQVTGTPAVIQNTKSFDYYEKVKGYTPKVTTLRMQITDSAFQIQLKLTVSPSAGIDIDFWVNAEYTFKITTKDGKQTIEYEQKSYSSGHSTTVEWWVWLVAAISGLVLGIIGSIIAVIIVLIIQAIVNASVSDPEASIFSNALKPIEWNHLGEFTLKHINLPGPVQVGGDVPILAK